MKKKSILKSIASNLQPRGVEAKRCQKLLAPIYLTLYGGYGVPAMAWDGKVKPFLFDMIVPQFFITAPCVLTGFRGGCNNRVDAKNRWYVAECTSDSCKRTCYLCAQAKGPRPGAEYLRKRNILVVTANSFPLSFCRRSPFLTVVDPATSANHAWNASPRRIS
jgi:hypothetical protein